MKTHEKDGTVMNVSDLLDEFGKRLEVMDGLADQLFSPEIAKREATLALGVMILWEDWQSFHEAYQENINRDFRQREEMRLELTAALQRAAAAEERLASYVHARPEYAR